MLNIGILGAAGIAPNAIIKPALRRDDVTVTAVGARSGERARAYAAEWDLPRAYSSYDEVLSHSEVDVVYNALPPSEHARWSIAALEAGKDVLCEKPFAMNAREARSVIETAQRTGKRVIEAFHDRYHPLSAEISRLAAPDQLGTIHYVEARFTVDNPFDPFSIRHDPAVGGGALMDLGCYPVHWARTLFGSEPTVHTASATRNELGADRSIEATLGFGSATALIVASMAEPTLTASLHVEAERGTLHVEPVCFPHRGHAIVRHVDGIEYVSTVAGFTTYDHQLEALVHGLSTGTPMLTEGDDIMGNMVVIDAIYAAAGFARP